MCQEIGKYVTHRRNKPIETKLKIIEMIGFGNDLKSTLVLINSFSVSKHLRRT